MKHYVDKIPKEIQDLKQWVCWKKGVVPKTGKTTKLPIDAVTGKMARVNDQTTFTTMKDAILGAERYNLDGIGFVLGYGYFGIDLDDCEEDLKNEFIYHMESYTETSQSGNGIHIICRGVLPKGKRRTKGIEMYDENRFFVMTGDVIGSYDIIDGTKKVKELHDKYLKEKMRSTKPITSVVEYDAIKLDDTDLLTKAQRSKNGQHFSLLMSGLWEGSYTSQSEADMAFCNLLAFWSGKDAEQMDRIFRMSGLYRDKWDRKQSGSTYGIKTIEKAIENAINVYSKPYEDETNITINAQTGAVYVNNSKDYELNDTGNAERFIDRVGDEVRYNVDQGEWMIWNRKFWQIDKLKQVKRLAEIILAEMRQEASMTQDETIRKQMLRNVNRAFQSAGKEAMLKECQHLDGVGCDNSDFDKDDFLINTESGIVDLKTGEIYEHNKDLYMSKIIPHEVDTTKLPTRWLSFLDEIFEGDKDLIHFIHKAIGYTLTGSIEEQSMFLAFGDGSNGKSVFLDIISKMLGDYGANAQVESLLERKYGSSSHSSDLARLKGARFTTTGENSQGSKLNEGLIKQLTGGEKITARFMYGTEFEFYPKFKIWLATNHKPTIRGNDSGIWRRIISIPFNYKVPKAKRNKKLVLDLQQEIPQILGWAIQGCLLWQKEGLNLPSAIESSNQQYQEEMDIIAQFLKEHTDEKTGSFVKASELYEEYIKWAIANNEWKMSSSHFGKEMSKRYEKVRKGYGNVYNNIRLKKDNPTYVYEKQS